MEGPLVIALDTGRGMREVMEPVREGLRHALGRLDRLAGLCALGDPRCHLLQASDLRPAPELQGFLDEVHLCGRDRSFETALYHYARRQPLRGTLVLCGNGPVRDAVAASMVRHFFGEDLDANPYTADLLAELQRACSVRMLYLSRGVYDTGMLDWEALLGPGSVQVLEDPHGTGEALLALAEEP